MARLTDDANYDDGEMSENRGCRANEARRHPGSRRRGNLSNIANAEKEADVPHDTLSGPAKTKSKNSEIYCICRTPYDPLR
ncbi:unnamed protein product [Protopolystoma xenopodis]|uniref:Uncharacterized protein n=1 Tax=Protopolystoma xenopodis TaxID=117903 RepID=A0A3S5BPI4_9PLAT|nr:unnamed protein product [Protopolystoma xenopodis]